jgi:predicted lipoprotein with Yx(FWY)xxD motif
MRKSGWTAATGLGSLVLLLTACGGSSGSSNAASGAASSSVQATEAGSSAAAPPSPSAAATSAAASKKATAGPSASAKPKPHHTAGPQPSSGNVSFNPIGTTVMIVQKSAIGYVLAEANGQVVYTYSKDKKDGKPTCTGTCADTWPAATGVPKAGPADTFPGTFAVLKTANGVEQITYNGYPLYLYKGAKAYTTPGNGIGGLWHVIPLSAGDISGG